MDLQGSLLRDARRAEVGRVRAVLLDPESKDARWLEVTLAASATVLVPAAAVSQFADGELLVPYSAEQIARATHESGASLTAEDARRLREHYGFADWHGERDG